MTETFCSACFVTAVTFARVVHCTRRIVCAVVNPLRICCLLVALLVIQPALAFYDSHRELQDTRVHLQTHHTDVPAESQGPTLPEHANPAQDCDHCCHCHGNGPNWLAENNPPRFDRDRQKRSPGRKLHFSTGHHSLPFRPPIL